MAQQNKDSSLKPPSKNFRCCPKDVTPRDWPADHSWHHRIPSFREITIKPLAAMEKRVPKKLKSNL